MATFIQNLLFLDAARLMPRNHAGDFCLFANLRAAHRNPYHRSTGANRRCEGGRASMGSAGLF